MSADPEELRALREAVRDFLDGHSDEEAVRKTIEAGSHDAAVWSRLADELGLAGLAVPEAHGGAGAGFAELRVVLGEQGRALLSSPFLPSAVLAVHALLASGDEAACARHLRLIAGGTIATVAVAEPGGAWDAPPRCTAEDRRLSGTKSFVLSGQHAELFLVVASTREGPSLFAVPADAPGIEVAPLPTLDGTRPMADVRFAGTPAELVGTAGEAGPVVRRVLDVAALALAAEQVGAARRCLEMSVEYAQTRKQFGRPIGGFQAVKHKLADMLTHVELADALVEGACLAAQDGTPDAAAVAVAAHLRASAAARFVAAETIQVHGGIGFTWEHPAHLYYRRAKASENLLGGPAVEHERLLDRLGI